jgi:4-methyl-5(b-hydroxyethyl)-thiazole monophosphate biosynthesis
MKKVLLLLANGFEMFEASVFIDVIGWNLIDGDKSTELITCGITKEVNTSFNQKIIANKILSDINVNDYDALAIPGGFEEYDFYIDAYSSMFIEIIQEFNKRNKLIASVCVGALPIGKSGVLNGRNGTTYKGVRQEQLRKLGVNTIDEPIVIDKNIITSWNPSTAVNVALKLLELLTNKKNAEYIQKLMGFS